MAAPLCLCLAGPNGSGKSTASALPREYCPPDRWIDPDQVAEQLRLTSGQRELTEDVSREAFEAARIRRCRLAADFEDFGFETVFSHGSNLAFLRALRSVGYEVHLWFVCTEHVDINVARVASRVEQNGHSVPEEKIRARYGRSLQLLSLAVRELDRVILFDNSDAAKANGRRLTAGRLVAEIAGSSGGQAPEFVSVFPPIPFWVLANGLFPLTPGWSATQVGRNTLARFEGELHFDPRVPGKPLEEFFLQVQRLPPRR